MGAFRRLRANPNEESVRVDVLVNSYEMPVFAIFGKIVTNNLGKVGAD